MKTLAKNLFVRVVSPILRALEKRYQNRDLELMYPPIFIIGNPRSGSTLLYQVIARYLKVCYFSNFMMLFPDSILSAAKFAAFLNGCDPPNSFLSEFGHARGLTGVNQGRAVWNRWFPDNYGYVSPATISEDVQKEIRRTIALIEKFFDCPFINKWQPLSERILAIHKIFPEVLFIRIKRNPVFIAQSILLGKRHWGDDMYWFSTKPRCYEKIKELPKLERICKQVHHIEEDLDEDVKTIGKDKVLTIHYEELCDDPLHTVNNVRKFYAENGGSRQLQERHRIPVTLHCANTVKLNENEFDEIKHFFEKEISGTTA